MFRRTTTRTDPDVPRGYTLAEPLLAGGRMVGLHAVQDVPGRPVQLFIATSAEEAARFRRLPSVLPRHQGVVEVYDTGRTPRGRPYVASACPGPSVHGVAATRALPAEEAVAIAARVADALAAVHAAGLVHGDVRPDYVLYDGKAPVLTGFWPVPPTPHAVSAASGDPGEALAYLAPEVIEGAEPSEAADVYALTATLYTLLAGRPAHAAASGGGPAALLRAKLHGAPPDIVRPDVDACLAGVLRRGMAPDPAARFASAAEFARALGGGADVRATDVPATDVPATAGRRPGGAAHPRAGARTADAAAPAGPAGRSTAVAPRESALDSLFAPDDDAVIVPAVIDGTMTTDGTADAEVIAPPRAQHGTTTRVPDGHAPAPDAPPPVAGTYTTPGPDSPGSGRDLRDVGVAGTDDDGTDREDVAPANPDRPDPDRADLDRSGPDPAGLDSAEPDLVDADRPALDRTEPASAPDGEKSDRLTAPEIAVAGTSKPGPAAGAAARRPDTAPWTHGSGTAGGGPSAPPSGPVPAAGTAVTAGSGPAPFPAAGPGDAAASALSVEEPAERSPAQRAVLIAAGALAVVAIAGVIGLVGNGRKAPAGDRHGGSGTGPADPVRPRAARPTVTQEARPPTKLELLRYQPTGLKAVPAPQQIVLTWHLPADGERDGAGIVIRQQPADGGNGIIALSRGPDGRLPLTYVGVPLRSGQQYCFLVGVLLQRAGGSPMLAQAAPICAVPR